MHTPVSREVIKFQVILHVISVLSKPGRVQENITHTKHTFMLLLLKQNVSLCNTKMEYHVLKNQYVSAFPPHSFLN